MITILQTPASYRKRALGCQKVLLFDKEVFAELNARFQSEAGIHFIYSARFILRR